MNAQTVFGLTSEDLEGAAHLSLRTAAFTDLDAFPFGSGRIRARESHDRKERFEKARERLEGGSHLYAAVSVSPEDLRWAASKFAAAKDPNGWRLRFNWAANSLEEQSTPTLAESRRGKLKLLRPYNNWVKGVLALLGPLLLLISTSNIQRLAKSGSGLTAQQRKCPKCSSI